MKIVFLSSSLDSGGAERVIASLCNAWAERGDKVTLVPTFSGGGQPFYEFSEAVELIYLADLVGVRGKGIKNYAKRLFALRSLIKKRKPDVIVSFLPNVNVTAILSSARLGIPLIIGERSDPTSYPHENYVGSLCRLTYRFADMLTVQTESVAEKVGDVYPGLKFVRTIANPLPDGVARYTKAECRGRKVLLSLGRLSPEKQIDRLLNAFALLAPDFQDWDLHIYGDGPMKAALSDQVQRMGLGDRALLMGATKSPWSVMAGAEAFVMTSKYEGFPNALLEAMGVGLPCVTFDCPSGPKDITRDGQDALLVPLDDHNELVAALRKIMSDKDLRLSLGKAARESVCQRFSLSKVMERWDGLFEEVGACR